MERGKLQKYRGLAPIRFLNDFNAGLLTAEEYKLIREVSKNDAWDELDSYIDQSGEAEQEVETKEPASTEKGVAAPVRQTATPPEEEPRIELRTDVKIERDFFVIPNDVIDVLAPLQTPAEEVVYRRLYRMSYGWRKNFCRTSIPHLLKTTNIQSRNTVRKALRGLIEKGHIAEYVNERGRVDANNDGTLYIVFLPEEIAGLSLRGSNSDRGSKFEGGTNSDPGSKNDPGQKLTPIRIGPENTDSREGGSKIEGSKIEGGSKSGRSKINPPAGQNLKGQKLTPLAQTSTDSSSRPGGSKFEGSINDPIKNIFKNNEKHSLSSREIISGFYNGIGQKKITKAKRERAENNFKELLNDGFKPEDVRFAVEWTLENAKEEFYDFSIIKHTIGQAIAAKGRVEAEKAKKLEQERKAAEKQKEEIEKEEERAKVETYKEELSSEERKRLRQRAESEIRNSGQFKEEFITDILIEAKENDLLREEMGLRLQK